VVNNQSTETRILSGTWQDSRALVRLGSPPASVDRFIPFDKMITDTSPRTQVVAIDKARRRFKFVGGEHVTIKVIDGDDAYKLFLYGYLPLEVTSMNEFTRLSPEHKVVHATLSSGQQADFHVPNNGIEFELQGVKVLPAEADSMSNNGKVSIPTIQPLPREFSKLSGVSMSGVSQGFTILVTWDVISVE
jgi:hypothetical protein